MTLRLVAEGRLWGFLPVKWTADVPNVPEAAGATVIGILNGKKVGPLTLIVFFKV